MKGNGKTMGNTRKIELSEGHKRQIRETMRPISQVQNSMGVARAQFMKMKRDFEKAAENFEESMKRYEKQEAEFFEELNRLGDRQGALIESIAKANKVPTGSQFNPEDLSFTVPQGEMPKQEAVIPDSVLATAKAKAMANEEPPKE